MDKDEQVTLLLVGLAGSGKSATGNAYLELDRFDESSRPYNPCTRVCSAIARVNNVSRCVIDTPGLIGVESEDVETLKAIVRFLRDYEPGVNAVAIVINGQAPVLMPQFGG